MTPRRKATLIIASLAIAVVGVAFWTVFEQAKLQDEQAIYAKLLTNDPEGIVRSWGKVAYVSLPIVCTAPYDVLPESSLNRLYESYREANSDRSVPVSLDSLAGRVPIVSLKAAETLASAGGISYVEAESAKLVALSRVGFNRWSGEAMLCASSKSFPHFRGLLIRLVKEDGKWKEIAGWDADLLR